MSQGVVDFLEFIEVDEHQRQRRSVAMRFLDFMLETILEHAPVRQVGERIEVGLLPDGFFRTLFLGDVLTDAGKLVFAALIVHQRFETHPHPAHAAVRTLGADLGLHHEIRLVGIEFQLDVIADAVRILGMDEALGKILIRHAIAADLSGGGKMQGVILVVEGELSAGDVVFPVAQTGYFCRQCQFVIGPGQFCRTLHHFFFQPVLLTQQALVSILNLAQHMIESQ